MTDVMAMRVSLPTQSMLGAQTVCDVISNKYYIALDDVMLVPRCWGMGFWQGCPTVVWRLFGPFPFTGRQFSRER